MLECKIRKSTFFRVQSSKITSSNMELIVVVFHHSINVPLIEKLTIQNWNLQVFKIIYSTQLQVHWISVLILISWCITKDLKQELLKLITAAANCLESTKIAQRYASLVSHTNYFFENNLSNFRLNFWNLCFLKSCLRSLK